MANRIRAKDILRLDGSGLSGRAIAASLGVSRNSVTAVLAAAKREGFGWEDARPLSDREVYDRLFPERAHEATVYPDPDWERIHRELARDGVTLKRLHAEYRDACSARGEASMGYDRFCKRYREFTVRKSVVSRVGHKAGRIMEAGWAGPTLAVVDPATGEVSKACLFVACLPFSRMSWVEPTPDMKQDTWLRCHVHAFGYFGGAAPCIVPDNLKTGVKRHPREGEVVINDAYREMAAHYGAAVMPARVRRPRDKPSAGNEVWQAATEVIAALRETVFTDFGALKEAVRKKVDEHNSRPFSKREGTRRQVFEEQERPLLRPLPAVPYEVCEWVYGRKVQRNCHVSYKRNFYSVTHLAVGRTVDLRVTESTVEVFLGGERLATHPLFPAYARNRYSTHEADLPDGGVVLGLGRRANPALGGEGRPVVRRRRRADIPVRGVRGAGVQRRARGAEALAQVLRPAAREGVRDGAGDGEALTALPGCGADTQEQPGQARRRPGGRRRRAGRGRGRIRPGRGLLRGGVGRWTSPWRPGASCATWAHPTCSTPSRRRTRACAWA